MLAYYELNSPDGMTVASIDVRALVGPGMVTVSEAGRGGNQPVGASINVDVFEYNAELCGPHSAPPNDICR